LAFRCVGTKYQFFGMVDDACSNLSFKPQLAKPKTTEERIKALKATHLLVLQAACIHNLSSYSQACGPLAHIARRAMDTSGARRT
jgi:hypothetical protein